MAAGVSSEDVDLDGFGDAVEDREVLKVDLRLGVCGDDVQGGHVEP